MTGIDIRRQRLLDEILAAGRGNDLHSLVSAVIAPFAEQLNDDRGGSHHARFSSQLFAQGRAMALLAQRQPRTDALHALLEMIRKRLASCPDGVVARRLALTADQVVHATAAEECESRGSSPGPRRRRVAEFIDNLVDYSVGGLTAPMRNCLQKSSRRIGG